MNKVKFITALLVGMSLGYLIHVGAWYLLDKIFSSFDINIWVMGGWSAVLTIVFNADFAMKSVENLERCFE